MHASCSLGRLSSGHCSSDAYLGATPHAPLLGLNLPGLGPGAHVCNKTQKVLVPIQEGQA